MDSTDGDFIELSQDSLNDEVLISLVRENSILYDKTLKDYKNKEVKLEIWKSIGEIFGCAGEQVEARWTTLRNIFTKKLREIKAGQPSGSGCKMTKTWVYFKQMSFLTPHIAHRASRSSMSESQQEQSRASQSIVKPSILTKNSTVKTLSSPLSLNNNSGSSVNLLTCSDNSISGPLFDESSSTSIAPSTLHRQSPVICKNSNDNEPEYVDNNRVHKTAVDIVTKINNNIIQKKKVVPVPDRQSPVTLKDSDDNDTEYINNIVQNKRAADIITENNNVLQKKKIVPALDQFAVKKQKTLGTIDSVLCQSSHALNIMATAYLNRATITEQQQHPYITAIAEAMKRVSNEQQLKCFMSIMEVISSHS